MKRRQFLKLLGSAATALPCYAALAQQQIPLVGFLNSASPDTYRFNADSFREGLAKAGFVEGKNVRIEERWGRGDYGALPTLAAELVAMGVQRCNASPKRSCAGFAYLFRDRCDLCSCHFSRLRDLVARLVTLLGVSDTASWVSQNEHVAPGNYQASANRVG